MKTIFYHKRKGFTLVETLVAITILMISIVGPMVIVSNGIKAAAYSRDQITAFYLAQDAIEALRFLRDNNRIQIVLGNIDWEDFIDPFSSCTAEVRCTIDTVATYRGGSASYEIGNSDEPLKMTSDGYYTYSDSGDETKFKRGFSVIADEKEMMIEVVVTWSSGSFGDKSFTVRESLMNWN